MSIRIIPVTLQAFVAFAAQKVACGARQHRRNGPVGERVFRHKLESLVYELKSALEPKYDPDLSADRFAVASYMRGEKEPPPKPALPRNLNTMSDSDLKKVLDRFEPGLAEKTRI